MAHQYTMRSSACLSAHSVEEGGEKAAALLIAIFLPLPLEKNDNEKKG